MMFVMFAMEIVYKITVAIKDVFILTLKNYVMLVLITWKISQSLGLFSKNSFGWKFLKIDSVIVYSFLDISTKLQVYRPTPVPPTALTIKVDENPEVLNLKECL